MRRVTKWYLALFVLVMISGLAVWFLASTRESRPSNAQLVFAEPTEIERYVATARGSDGNGGSDAGAVDLLACECEGIGGRAA